MQKALIALLALSMLTSVNLPARNAIVFGWGNTEKQYDRFSVPEGLVKSNPFQYKAWKGERLNAEAVIRPDVTLTGLRLEAGNLRCGKASIPAESVSVDFLGYVWAEIFAEQYVQCQPRGHEWDSLLVADMISARVDSIEAGTNQPVWVSVDVPQDAAPGEYKGSILLFANELKMPLKLGYSINVIGRELPPARDWKFHLDLWQNPFAVARYHGVPLWSKEHFDHMRPVMEKLASAGQKVVTASIMDRPWNGQTEDPFKPMVTKIRRADGSWLYDYTVFDMWVRFMFSCGIDRQINCYTLIPWKLEFDYFDQASNSNVRFVAGTGTTEYNDYWGSFITDFAAHLKKNGWFDITCIAMDERAPEAMRNALDLIHSRVPDFKVSLAGHYHAEIADELFDLSVTYKHEYPDGAVAKRRSNGQVSTYYTCCAEKYPNTFIMSPPAEASWIPWVALKKDVDGYLRWAYNSWTANPVIDGRFRTWPAGDCFMVYPEGKSGVHLEKLIEGVQQYEKAVILRDEWTVSGDKESLDALNAAISAFTFENITAEGAIPTLTAARKAIDK